ncbi:MAG: cytochrome c biogenesis protein [Desulfovibrio sp.]|nr:cytochrome c biogenesis protein [Desulfovibrio sp.]MCA1986477.1 cytochrome c biogenesis protein [Desulfovibrio sp.]
MSLFAYAYLLIVLAYLGATGLSLFGALRRRPGLRRAAVRVAFGGFLLHTMLLGHFFATETIPEWSAGVYLKMLSWCVLAVSFVLWHRLRWDFLSLMVSPVALLLFASSITHAQGTVQMPKALHGVFFALHIGVLFASIALLAVACGAGLLFVHQERKIKTKVRLAGFLQDMPGLSALDRVNHWAVCLGFPLFTLGMLTGFVFARMTWGKMLSADPKEFMSLTIWALFAWLFYGRLFLDWRGRRPAKMAMLLFALAVVSIAGVNFFLQSHHGLMERP